MRAVRQLLSNPFRRQEASTAKQRVRSYGTPDVAAHEAAIQQAAALAREGRLERALAHISGALAQDPNNSKLRYERGLVLLDWDRTREALADFLTAEREGFSGLGLHVNIAQTAHRLGIGELAERHVRRALALDPGCVTAHIGLGAIAQGAKHYDAAIESDATPDRHERTDRK